MHWEIGVQPREEIVEICDQPIVYTTVVLDRLSKSEPIY